MGPPPPAATITVTRPVGRERELCERLLALGHRVLHVPLVAVEPVGDEPVEVEGYDWVVLTSVVGAQELRRRMTGTPRKVAAVGRATADAFGRADVVASTSTQEGLLAALPRETGRVLFAGAEGARSLLPETLGADIVVLYRTVELVPEHWPESDLVVLASPSAARAYGALRSRTPAVSIGPETTRAAKTSGVGSLTEAAKSDLDGLVAAIESALGGS